MRQHLLALGIGLTTGFGGGLLSLGGGTLAIPLMLALLRLDAFQARGTALALALFSAGTGVVVYFQGHQIDWWAVLWIALPSALLAPRIAKATERFRGAGLVRIFGICLILGAGALFLKESITEASLVPAGLQIPFLVFIGVLEGLVAGSVGVSGGPIIAPLLVLGLGMPQQLAQGCSLAARIPAVMTSLAENQSHHHVCWQLVPALAGGAIVGASLGGMLALRLHESHLRALFALLILLLGLRYLVKGSSAAAATR